MNIITLYARNNGKYIKFHPQTTCYLQAGALLCAVCILIDGCRNKNIVKTQLTDSEGTVLVMEFDKTAGTATFVYKGDTIHLKQDNIASGIRYSNPHYVYLEWQGHCTLCKDSLVAQFAQ